MSDIEVANKAVTAIAGLASGAGIFSTIEGKDLASKKQILAAMTNAKPLADFLDVPIALRNVITQAVSVNDAATGEEKDVVRTILIAEDGDAYTATSDGILGSLRDIFAILGMPNTWDEPIPVRCVEMKGNSGRRFMKLVLA